jgi:hypothetical protein
MIEKIIMDKNPYKYKKNEWEGKNIW